MKPAPVGSLLLCLTLACGPELSAPAAAGLSLRVAVTSTDIQAGQPDTITVTLANANPYPVTLRFASGCHVLPYIRDARGAIVLPDGGGWLCSAMLTQLTLAAGQQEVDTYIWAGSTVFASEMPTRSLPAGVYRISAAMSAREVQLLASPVAVRLF
jgi:hypothetical protein